LITLHHLAPLPTLAEKVLCFRLFRADLVPFVPGSPNSGADGLTRYRYYAICAASRGQINLVSPIFYSHSYTANAERHSFCLNKLNGVAAVELSMDGSSIN
jgi:hypothetical protein